MFNLFAHTTQNMDNMVTITEAKTVLAGLILIIIALLVIVIYMANTWQPKSFTTKQKESAAKKIKKVAKAAKKK